MNEVYGGFGEKSTLARESIWLKFISIIAATVEASNRIMAHVLASICTVLALINIWKTMIM